MDPAARPRVHDLGRVLCWLWLGPPAVLEAMIAKAQPNGKLAARGGAADAVGQRPRERSDGVPIAEQ
jgi:hypothetical protein